MGYRIDPEGYSQLVDAVQAGSTSSGADVYDDGVRSPYMDKPFSSREELLMNEGLRVAMVPAEEIRKIRPITPMAPFPDEGLAFDREALTIEEALDAKRWQPSMRSFVSGSTQVTNRDVQEDVWSGTSRNTSSSLNPM